LTDLSSRQRMAGLNGPFAPVVRIFTSAGKEGTMVKTTLAAACVLSLGIVSPLRADDDGFLRFNGGIGVIPVSSQAANGTINRNIVRGVNPPGQIWVIRALRAEVDPGGHITVRGRGLLLGGGNGIGTNGNQSVFASLFCGNVEHSTERTVGVPLAPNGDFRIDDMLDNLPLGDCASPVLLIRSLGGTWFAAGIPDLGDDN
jgi:hypothetical protein